jgi:hypothetical protein
MARTYGTLTTSGDISTGTAAKTILQITAPANTKIAVQKGNISFRGNSPTADKILVQLVRSATGGSGATTRNPAKIDATDSTSIQSTGKEGYTAEPSSGTVVYEDVIHPQGSLNLPEEIIVKPGETLAWVTNAPASVNCRARFKFEE